MSSYRAILWDNDGILVDTEHLYFEATQSVMAEIGFNLTSELYQEHFLKSSQGAWHLAERVVENLDVEVLKSKRFKLYAQLLGTREILIPGVEAVIEELGKHYRMAVVTSSRKEHFEIIHQGSGLLKHFEFVLASGDYPRSKPDPSPYELAVKKIGLRKSECLVIEDSERGLKAAKAAGLDCWCIPSKLTQGSDFSKADKIVDSITSLTRLMLTD